MSENTKRFTRVPSEENPPMLEVLHRTLIKLSKDTSRGPTICRELLKLKRNLLKYREHLLDMQIILKQLDKCVVQELEKRGYREEGKEG